MIDNGVLPLYLAKVTNANASAYWGDHKNFPFSDFHASMLADTIDHFETRWWTTPHVLVEAQRAVRKDVRLTRALHVFARTAREHWDASTNLPQNDVMKFGFTDAAILAVAESKSLAIIGKDRDLLNVAADRGIAVFNVIQLFY